MKSVIVSSILALSFSMHAFAIPPVDFKHETFSNLASQNEVVVVGFHSKGCGSCKVQKPNFIKVLKEVSFNKVYGLLADFDDSAKFRQELSENHALSQKVYGPSTLVIFKNGKEIGRTQAVETDEIRNAILQAL